MDNITVLVLADPTEPRLAMLEELPPETGIAVGNSAEAFVRAAPDATVIFNWSLMGDLQREVFRMCPKVEWVHSRSAGLDGLLFPELVESPVRLTNGSGVFSESLGEFVVGAILYFAKDLRRMIRNQAAGVWEPFDIVEVRGQTVGIVGYGDIGRAVATRVRALGMRVLGVKRHGPPAREADPLAERIYGPEGRIEMISRSDYVVVAAPLTPETVGLIGEPEFAAMKPDAVVDQCGPRPGNRGSRAGQSPFGKAHQGRGAGCFRYGAAARGPSVLQAGKRAALPALRGPHAGLAGPGDAVLSGAIRAVPQR